MRKYNISNNIKQIINAFPKISIKNAKEWAMIIAVIISVLISPHIFNIFESIRIDKCVNINNEKIKSILDIIIIVLYVLILPFIVHIANKYIHSNTEYISSKMKKYCMCLGVIGALCLTIGYSYYKTGSYYFCFGNFAYFCISIYKIVVYALLLYQLIICGFIYLDKYNKIQFNSPIKKTTKSTFFLILLCQLPYVLFVGYNGLLCNDTCGCIAQFMHVEERTIFNLEINPDMGIYISNHHPVIFTFLYGMFAKFGLFINNSNIPFLLLSFFQVVLYALIVTYLLKTMANFSVKPYIIRIVRIIYCFYPILAIWNVAIYKDSLYSIMLLLFSVLLLNIVYSKGKIFEQIKYCVSFVIACLFVCLTSNKGIYVIIATCIFMLVAYKKYWLPIIITHALVICIYMILFMNILLPALNIAPSGVHEKYGFMFQQTARSVKFHSEEISMEDKNIIDRVLPYDSLPLLYDATSSDAVKFRFKHDCDNEDLNNYKKTWLNMFFRHPGSYINASVSIFYASLYPILFDNCFPPSQLEYEDKIFANKLEANPIHVNILRYIFVVFETIPIINILFNIGFINWLFVLLLFYMCYKNGFKNLLFIMPAFVTIMFLFVSPVTDFRYILPIAYIIPLMLGFCMNIESFILKKGSK